MADKKRDAIFRMEEKDGKLYRVMYFKNYRGNYQRSKFIKEVNREKKKSPKKNNEKIPKKTPNVKPKNTVQVRKNTKPVRKNTKPVPQRTVRKKSVGVKRSSNTQKLINRWVELAKK